jgi:hypothetical protein
MRKLPSAKTSWTVIRSFLVNPSAAEDLASDENPFTSVMVDGMKTFEIPSDALRCCLLMNDLKGREVIVRLAAADGTYIAEFPVTTSYFEFNIKDKAVKVEILGNAEIFEAIFVK